jgi:hypothetical protein
MVWHVRRREIELEYAKKLNGLVKSVKFADAGCDQ